jgi:hypothetical protein
MASQNCAVMLAIGHQQCSALLLQNKKKPHFCGFFMGKSIALFFEHRYNATPF